MSDELQEEARTASKSRLSGFLGYALQHYVSPLFDALERRYESEEVRRALTVVLVVVFVGGIIVADMMRRGILFEARSVSHFVAVEIVFTGLLLVEIVGLVMGIVGSVANAMGKQIEILSLIMLRDAFKEFSHFGEPIEWSQIEPYVLVVLADIGGSLALFVLLGVYYRIQKRPPITSDAAAMESFIAVKKLVALTMIAVFILVGVEDLVRGLLGWETYPFFETFYTILIFSDILVVLISLRYTKTYAVVFRNSGFTLTTVLIRLALTAPPLYGVALGLGAGLLALALAWAYTFFPREQ